MYTQSNLPILPPVTVEVPLGTTEVISFPNRFFGTATSVIIKNNDAVNQMTYRVGGSSRPAIVIPASGNNSIDNTIINLLEINTGAGGSCTVSAQVVLDPRSQQASTENTV